MARATSHFDVVGWDQAAYDEPAGAPQLARATVRKVFRGDLEGESVGEALLCQTDPSSLDLGGGYVVSERVAGSIAGRRGTFVLQHGGLGGAGVAPRTFGHVVPGSGTGDLAGLSGTIEISVTPEEGHVLTIDYALSAYT